MRYLDRKVSGSPCRCSNCLRPRCIQNNDFHVYVQGILLLKEQRVVDTKLRFCLSVRCVNGISIAAAEKEKVIAEEFNINMDRLIVN